VNIFLSFFNCLQGGLANHATGSWFAGMVARHLIEKLCHSHPFRYAESWMVLPGSTSLLYKQIQLGLHPTHVHDVMTWQCCDFLGWWWSNCHGNKRVLQQDDLFFHLQPTQSAFSNMMMMSQTHLVIHQNDPCKTRSEGKGERLIVLNFVVTYNGTFRHKMN